MIFLADFPESLDADGQFLAGHGGNGGDEGSRLYGLTPYARTVHRKPDPANTGIEHPRKQGRQ
jgi:hypothetical protein